VNNTLDIEESGALSSFVISTCDLSWVVGMSAVPIANFVVCFGDDVESTMFHFLPNFTQNLMSICCSKNLSLIFATRGRNALALMC
jgi:hypothetical protein